MKTFYFGLLFCLGVTCLDVHYSFIEESGLLNGEEKNLIMREIMRACGMTGAMAIRLSASMFVVIILAIIRQYNYIRISWFLMLVWFIQQSTLLIIFWTPNWLLWDIQIWIKIHTHLNIRLRCRPASHKYIHSNDLKNIEKF